MLLQNNPVCLVSICASFPRECPLGQLSSFSSFPIPQSFSLLCSFPQECTPCVLHIIFRPHGVIHHSRTRVFVLYCQACAWHHTSCALSCRIHLRNLFDLYHQCSGTMGYICSSFSPRWGGKLTDVNRTGRVEIPCFAFIIVLQIFYGVHRYSTIKNTLNILYKHSNALSETQDLSRFTCQVFIKI